MSEKLNLSGDAAEPEVNIAGVNPDVEENIENSAERIERIKKELGQGGLEKYTVDQLEAFKKELEDAVKELQEQNAKFDEAEAAPAAGETENKISPEAARETAEKMKKNGGAKEFFKKKSTKVIAIILAAALALGFASSTGIFDKNNKESDNTSSPTEATQDVGTEVDIDNEINAEKLGIYDGYGETGMYLSENKAGQYNFACASEVAELFENDEVEMIKYTAHNQVESFADYLANIPEELQPEEFRGLTILETEKKLEELSDEDFSNLEKYFQDVVMENAFTRRVTLNGTYDNAYMRVINPTQEINHDNMELVRCTTNERDIEVVEFYWLDKDGNEIGSMDVKIIPVYDDDGNIVGYEGCEQVVTKAGSPVYEGLDELPDDPNTGIEGTGTEGTGSEGTGSEGTGSEGTGSEGTGSEGTGSEGTGSEGTGSEGTGTEGTGTEGTGTEGTGTEGTGTEGTGTEGTGEEGTGSELTPKDPVVIEERAGDRVDERELDVDVTPGTSLEEDQQNFEAIRQQQEEEAARQAEADRVRAEQEAAEQAAAEEAAARRAAEEEAARRQSEEEAAREAERQAAADEAQRQAEAQAAEAQRQAAEAERRAAEEEAARQAAQAEADAQAQANEEEAQSNDDAGAGDRAGMFENGDF